MTSAIRTGTLRFHNVSKTFETGTQALAGVDLSLAPGDFVSVVGPSGCGKSTLLRVASGLSSPTDGEILADTDKVGYVFQDPTLLDWRSAEANVELIGELSLASKRFATLWARHDVKHRSTGPTAFYHPQVGPLDLHYTILHLPDQRQILVTYHADPGSLSEESLRLLASLAT